MIIGITGKAGSGKDTVADFLIAEHGYTKYSWAAPIKAALAAMGFPEPDNREDKEKVIEGLDVSWRYLAQTLGTDWGRQMVDNDLWVKLARPRLVGKLVIPDVRFNNEADLIRESGGVILHLIGRQADLGLNGDHASEKGVSYMRRTDVMVDNSCSFEITKGIVRGLLGSRL